MSSRTNEIGASEVAARATDGASPAHPDGGEVVLEEVRKAIARIDFGSILIKIHDGEVVGIETSTKVRLKGSRKST